MDSRNRLVNPFGATLRELRRRKDIKQSKLALRLRCSDSTISNWESQDPKTARLPSIEQYQALTDALDLSRSEQRLLQIDYASSELRMRFGARTAAVRIQQSELEGNHRWDIGDLDNAIYFFERALEERSPSEDRIAYVNNLKTLAEIYSACESYFEALASLQKAETIPLDAKSKAQLRRQKGIILRRMGRYDEAQRELQEALDFWESSVPLARDPNYWVHDHAQTLIALGDVFRVQDDLARAAELSQLAMKIVDDNEAELPNADAAKKIKAQAKYAFGRVRLAQKQWDGEYLVVEAFSIMQSLQERGLRDAEICARILGEYFASIRDWSNARRWLLECFLIDTVMGVVLRKNDILLLLLETARVLGQPTSEAMTGYVYDQILDAGTHSQKARIRLMRGNDALAAGRVREAVDNYKQLIQSVVFIPPTQHNALLEGMVLGIRMGTAPRTTISVVNELLSWVQTARVKDELLLEVEANQRIRYAVDVPGVVPYLLQASSH